MSTFIPATGRQAPAMTVSHADPFWPSVDTDTMRATTGLGETQGVAMVAEELADALGTVALDLAAWRATQTTATLDELGPAATRLFVRAVYCTARAGLLVVTRDYDSTKAGHARADALEPTADDWLAKARFALARLTARGRAVVELI